MRDDERLKFQRLIFYQEDIQLIDKVLVMFLKKSHSKCALLIDKEGHLITKHGDTRSYDMDTICTLLASTFAATREWAKLLGEEEFSVLFHQGKKDSIQVALVGDRVLLATIFDDRTQLGLVRLMSNEVAKKLNEIFTQAENKKRPETEDLLEEGFTMKANQILDDLFSDEDF